MKVVEAGNLTCAAKSLRISQPALGLQIRQLEQDCGVQLLSRHSRGIIPTGAGRFLYDKSKQILELVSETHQNLAQFRLSSNERLRIGLPRSIMRQLGSSLLLEARDAIPDVFLEITEAFNGTLLEAAQRNEIDVGLIYDITNSNGVLAVPILREDIVLVSTGDMPCSGMRDVKLEDALRCRLVFQREHSLVKRAVEEAAGRHSIRLDIAFEAQSTEAISEAVECSLAAAIIPYGIMSASIRSGKVRARRIIEPRISRTLFLVRPQRQNSFKNRSAIEEFIGRLCSRLIESLSEFSTPLQRHNADFMCG